MKSILPDIKNFIYQNLRIITTVSLSAFFAVIVLLWITLLVLWASPQMGALELAINISVSVFFAIILVASILVFFNKLALDRARLASLEAELAKNLITVNNYRKAVLDLEKVSNGEQ